MSFLLAAPVSPPAFSDAEPQVRLEGKSPLQEKAATIFAALDSMAKIIPSIPTFFSTKENVS
jgi:hypothetical protein